MSWSIKEIGERTGRFSLDGYTREYRRVFQVITDSAAKGALEVCVGLGVAWGDAYVAGSYTDSGAICTDINATQPEPRTKPTLWHVEVTYKSRSADPALQQETGGGGGGGGGGSPSAPQDTNPLHQPAMVMWGSKTRQVAIRKDINGKPIVNTAGSEFELQSKEERYTTLKITRNEEYFDSAEMEQYKGKVNSSTFQSRVANTVLCEDITASRAFSNNFAFWSVTYEFAMAPGEDTDFWKLVLVDKGRKYFDGPSAGPVSYVSPTGVSGDEIFLNGVDGQKHASFDLVNGIMAPGASVAVLKFTYRESINFGTLALPNAF